MRANQSAPLATPVATWWQSVPANLLKTRIRDVLSLVHLEPTRTAPFLHRRYRYRPDPQLLELLGPDLAAETSWAAVKDPKPARGDLAEIFFSTDNVHKWVHYFPIYERALGALRQRPIRFLEIGVFRGGSLAAWKRYFHSESTIVGIDIEPSCNQFDDPERNVHVRIGKQQDPDFLRAVVEELGPFDVILDDGSHMTSHMIDSFRFLFGDGLVDGGLYLAEDVHSSYWSWYRDSRYSFVDFARGLVDLIHAHYPQARREDQFRAHEVKQQTSFMVPKITTLLESIEFHDSVVVARRAPRPRELPYSVFR